MSKRVKKNKNKILTPGITQKKNKNIFKPKNSLKKSINF